VPKHLRDAHYSGAKGLGHGDGYDYPHSHDGAWVSQQHRPDHLESKVYYEPSDQGYEATVAARLARRIDPGQQDSPDERN